MALRGLCRGWTQQARLAAHSKFDSIEQVLCSRATASLDAAPRWLSQRLSSTPACGDAAAPPAGGGETIEVTFHDEKDGSTTVVQAPVGKSILEVAHDNHVELEGACEGSLACSTCHVILEQAVYDKLPEPDDDENDMLDLAFGLTETSRLGCQITCSKELEGMKLRIPSATRNMAVDGFVPKPH